MKRPSASLNDIHRRDKQVGATLSRLRTEAGLSSEALARKLGLEPDELARIESGQRRASPELMIEVCTIFDKPVSALFEGLPRYPPD